MQKQRRQKQSENGVDIAQHRGGLRAKARHAAEVQSVGKARVENADDQNERDRKSRRADRGKILGQKKIRNHCGGCGKKLNFRFSIGVLHRDLLVQKNDGGVKNSGECP